MKGSKFTRYFFLSLTFFCLSLTAYAMPVITNGSFETISTAAGAPANDLGVGGQLGTFRDVAGWSIVTADTDGVEGQDGYHFVFAPDANSPSGTEADNGVGVSSDFVGGSSSDFQLWGPGNETDPNFPANNGLGLSPDGGNFIATDGAFRDGPFFQSGITGFTNGSQYVVTFYAAAGQQEGFDAPGGLPQQLAVWLGTPSGADGQPLGTGATPGDPNDDDLGFDYFTDPNDPNDPNTLPPAAGGAFGNAILTPRIDTPDHGFSGWQQYDFTFTADNTTQTLAFIALGLPRGQPPFILIDGVSIAAVAPEIDASSAMLPLAFVLFLMACLGHRKAQPG